MGFPIWSDEWCVVCKLSRIGSALLISECWHLDLLSSALPWQNDYFFIISLIFHHYCTSPSFLPNYYCQLPFWKAIILWVSIIPHLWDCPCARAPSGTKKWCYIHIVDDVSTFLLGAVSVCSATCFWAFVLHPLAMQWHFSLVYAALFMPPDVLAAIGSHKHRIIIMFVKPFLCRKIWSCITVIKYMQMIEWNIKTYIWKKIPT